MAWTHGICSGHVHPLVLVRNLGLLLKTGFIPEKCSVMTNCSLIVTTVLLVVVCWSLEDLGPFALSLLPPGRGPCVGWAAGPPCTSWLALITLAQSQSPSSRLALVGHTRIEEHAGKKEELWRH